MSKETIILQKIIDLLIWDDGSLDKIIFTIEEKESEIVCRCTKEKNCDAAAIVIVNNKQGKSGLAEVSKIVSQLHWSKINSFILLTEDRSQLCQVEKEIKLFISGSSEIYGIDPDYYFSLVPLKSENHKRIEKFFLSLKNRRTLKEKIKILIKTIFVLLNKSSVLYERYVFLFSCDKKP